MTKSLFAQTILDKILGTKLRDPVKMHRTWKVWYLPYVFWLLLPKFSLRKGDWALGYVSTQIWDFPCISLFPNILSLKWFGNLWLIYQVCYTRYHVLFYLWWIEHVLKHGKVPKYYDQDCRYEVNYNKLRYEVDFFLWLGIRKHIYLTQSSYMCVIRQTWAFQT